MGYLYVSYYTTHTRSTQNTFFFCFIIFHIRPKPKRFIFLKKKTIFFDMAFIVLQAML